MKRRRLRAIADRLGVLVDDDGGLYELGREESGPWLFDEDDYLLYALLCDPIYCAELLGEDPQNREYAGMFKVRAHQYPLFRPPDPFTGVASARDVGKTESIKWRSVSHAFKRVRQGLLLTAPQLIHLLPLTMAVEAIYRRIRLLREFVDTSNGRTGYTHRPFGIQLRDGTYVKGAIPGLKGTGVKGNHQPDLIIDEAQDYPDPGWTEVHSTVQQDTVDAYGKPDFSYHFYGVHSGSRDSGFHARTTKGGFKVVQITAMQKPTWNKREKTVAIAAFGGTQSPDYRRNVLGEAGAAATHYFVTARLMACMDQNPESDYNAKEYEKRVVRHEDFAELLAEQERAIAEAENPRRARGELLEMLVDILRLPGSGYGRVWIGMDVGLTSAPSVIHIFAEQTIGGVIRLKLIRRILLWRWPSRQQRQVIYAMMGHFGAGLKGMGIDSTGLGLPMTQEMRDDPDAPAGLDEVLRGYLFNANVEVAVDKRFVQDDGGGRLRDQFGAAIKKVEDPLSGITMYVTTMPMIEASTKYLRDFVDSTTLLLPFDAELIADFQNETAQRVARIAGLKNKPNALHDLDASRAMAMRYRAGEVEEMLEPEPQEAVLDIAI